VFVTAFCVSCFFVILAASLTLLVILVISLTLLVILVFLTLLVLLFILATLLRIWFAAPVIIVLQVEFACIAGAFAQKGLEIWCHSHAEARLLVHQVDCANPPVIGRDGDVSMVDVAANFSDVLVSEVVHLNVFDICSHRESTQLSLARTQSDGEIAARL